jgi:outer membrane protein assembly factor BamB
MRYSGKILAVAFALVAVSLHVAQAAQTTAEPNAQDTRATESLRADVFGNDEDAADAWAQLNAFIRHSRWSDAAATAQELLTHQPAVLIRQARDASLYWPVRRLVGDLFAQRQELRDAYRDAYDLDAQALMNEFESDERLQSLERLLARFPYASFRGQALRKLADGYLDRADFPRAAATFAQLQLIEKTSTNSIEMAVWACKEASSLLEAGCVDQAAEKAAQIRKSFGNATTDLAGRPFKVSDFCDRLEKEIGKGRNPLPQAPLSMDRLRSTPGWSFAFNTPPTAVSFRRKYPDRLPLYTPTSFNGIAYATDGNELRAVEIATGREQWLWLPERPGRYNVSAIQPWLEQLSPTLLRPAVTDRYVLFLRPLELAETVHSVCCLDRRTGQLLWQRIAWSGEHEAIETAPVAVGDRAFVIVSTLKRFRPDRMVVEQRAVVCFRIETGECVWRSPLPPPRPATANDMPGGVAGPFVSSTSLLVLEDRGPLYCLDSATGEIRWTRLIAGPETEPMGRLGSGSCVAAGERACVARAGSPQVECFDLQSGQRLWSQAAGAAVRWLATDGARVFVAGQEMRALALANGSPMWHGDRAEPPIGPGCLAGDFALVPTANALHVFETKSGRLIDRLTWLEKRSMTHLAFSNGDIVGLVDDTICKFGKPGLAPVIVAMAQPATFSPQPQPPREQPAQDELASRLFPNVRVKPGRDRGESFSAIGRPLTEWPSEWIVYDASARRLRRYSANNPTTPRWEVEYQGEVRSIEFDGDFIYILRADGLEIRSMAEGRELFRKQTQPIGKPLFSPGRVVWAYERSEGGSKRIYLAGYDARSRRGFDAPISDVGLQELCAYSWESDRLLLLGSKAGANRIFLAARIEGERLRPQNQGVPADERVRGMNFSRAAWVTMGSRLFFVGPDDLSIYAYNLNDGRRLWKCQLESENRNRRPLVILNRLGRYLLWGQVANPPGSERKIGVIDRESGEKLGTVEGEDAFIYRSRIYSLFGRLIRAHEIRDGRVIKAIQYPQRGDELVWLQAFGSRLVVATADREGAIRRVLLQDPELAEVVVRGRTEQPGRQTEIPVHREPIRIDGSVDDWERVRLGWQEIPTWRPALDRNGQAMVAQRPADFSARWRACVREDVLYLVVAVLDDRIVSNRWSDCPWIGDSLEVALRGERFARNMPTFTLSLDGSGQCWAAGPRLPAEQSCVRYDPLEREIIYEMAFPLSWLNKAGILAQRDERGRTELAFDLVVNDSDGAGLKGSLEWGDGLVESWNPSDWKVLRFETGGRE